MGIVKVAGIWEIGWNTPYSEYDLWEYPLKDFGVDEWYMTPVTGIAKQLTEVHELQDAISQNPDLQVVFVDEKADTPLKDFVHPENVLYVLGRTSISPYISYKREQDMGVRIETKPIEPSGGLLWSHQAISIVLYDRLMKKV
jgi:hypothetical protein